MRVAIHQPNFFPWTGFFNKIVNVDIFIFLDDAQMPKGSSWLNRTLICGKSEPRWVTVPVKKYRGFKQINQIEFSTHIDWRGNFVRQIENNYSNHPFFPSVINILRDNLTNGESQIHVINRRIIEKMVELMNLKSPGYFSSTSLGVTSTGTIRLCELTKAVGGQSYFCGGGSNEYLEEETFKRYGIDLELQNFSQKTYPQFGINNFIPGLSIVDLLMNCGFKEASNYVT